MLTNLISTVHIQTAYLTLKMLMEVSIVPIIKIYMGGNAMFMIVITGKLLELRHVNSTKGGGKDMLLIPDITH